MKNQSFQRVGNEFTSRTADEIRHGDQMRALAIDSLRDFGPKWDIHLPLFLTAPSLARILWLDLVYQKSLDVPGQIVEFGSQWGASLNIFLLIKLIREPWNASRIINSFSTFSEGFVSLNDRDGALTRKDDYAVSREWEKQLEAILEAHAARSPVGSENNVRIFEGDATKTFPEWLEKNPEAVISHAHFDMDVYEPTRKVLDLCLTRMPKGSVLIFDELNCPSFPGETRAVQDALGISRLALKKVNFNRILRIGWSISH